MATKKRSTPYRNPRPRIIQSATSLFAQYNAVHVGVDSVAAKAAVSKASLYKEFPTKNDLIAAVIIERSIAVHTDIFHNAQNQPAGIARIITLCANISQWHNDPHFTGCLIINTAINLADPHIKEIAQLHIQHYYDFIMHELTAAGIESAEELTKTIITLIEGSTLLRALGSTLASDLVSDVEHLLAPYIKD